MVFGSSLVNFLIYCIPILSTHAAVPSPKASTALICHTNHASQCYPQIFQATDKFQTVHDDQNLPPGLHVRMNLATGVKEARLNVPESEADDNNSYGLTIIEDTDLLGYEPTVSEDSPVGHEDAHTQQPIRSPPHDGDEGSVFSNSADIVKNHDSTDSERLLTALTDLEDLSHSYNWGLTLAKDVALSHRLFQLLLPSQASSLQVRSLAALVFGTAIHNNPAALNTALSHFYSDEWPEGPLETVILALLHEQIPILLHRMMFLLSALCQDENQLKRFLDAGGIDILIRLYDLKFVDVDDRNKLKKKITHFVVDYLGSPMSDNVSELKEGVNGESDIDAEWTIVRLQQLRHDKR